MASSPVLMNTTSELAIVAATEAGDTGLSEFDRAFDQIAAAEVAASAAAPGKTDGGASAGTSPSAPEAVNAQEGEAAREVAAAQKVATPPAEGGGEELPADDAAIKAQEAEAAKTPQQPSISDDEFVRRLAGLINKPQAEPQQQTQVEEPFRPVVTPEVAAVIKDYAEQYPDVMKGEQAIRTVEMQHFAHFVFTEIAKAYQPFIDQISIIAERTHLGDIQARVPDYAVTRPEVEKWVQTQPDFIRDGMQSVIRGGTAAQVATLINMYKEANPRPAAETGAGDQANSQANAQVNAANQNQPKTPATPVISPQVKAAAAKLAPTPGKRTGAPAAVVPVDFGDAFEHWSKIA